MKRKLLSLILIAVAVPATAQTVQTPAADASSTDIPIVPRTGSAADTPEMANAPIPPTAAAALAKKRIEMDGYRDVQGLAKGPDGLWQGTAMRGNTSVQVTVDRAGKVAAK